MTGTKIVKFKFNLPQEVTDEMVDNLKVKMVEELAGLVERIELNRLYEADRKAVDAKIAQVKSNLPPKPVVNPDSIVKP